MGTPTAQNLVVVQRSEPFSERVKGALTSKGYNTRIVSDPKGAQTVLSELEEPILIIDCGNKGGSGAYLKEFTAQNALHQFPILVLGRDVEGSENELSKFFSVATSMKIPYSPKDLIEAVNFIWKLYRRQKDGDSSVEEKDIEDTSESVEVVTRPEAPEPGHPLYEKFASIPSLFFQQLQNFRLLEQTLGGALYARQIRANDLENLGLLPEDQRLRETIQQVWESAGKWGGPHLYRTAYLAAKIMEPLGIEPDLKQRGRNASFLYALSFSQKNRSLLRKEYHGRSSMFVRKDICSLVKDSALQLSTDLQLPTEGKIVSILGKLIGKEEIVSDDPMYVVASAILAADAADRVCFQGGYWSTRAAHSLIRRIKEGKLREPHPAVLCCLVKILAEAITAYASASLLPVKVRENWELREKSRENKEGPISQHEEKVTLDSLTPGMKLSRPLYAFDGRMILSEDLILDQDLIWRIWQLSAVRPLNAPVVVLKK